MEGLNTLNIEIASSDSPIIPIKIGNPTRTAIIAKKSLERGVYTNCIVYSSIAKKDARIQTSLMETHTKDHLDIFLNALEDIGKDISLKKNRDRSI